MVWFIWKRNGWRSANDVTHRKRVEDFGNLKKVKRVETRCRTRRFDFWGLLRRDKFVRHGCCTRLGPEEEASIKRFCLFPYVETFNSKVIKRFRTWTKKLLPVFKFRDSYVLYAYMLSKWVRNIRCTFRTWPYLAVVHYDKIIEEQVTVYFFEHITVYYFYIDKLFKTL